MKKIKLFFLKRFALNSFICEDFKKSLKYFNKIYAIEPGLQGILYNIALSYLGLGDYIKAEKYMHRQMRETGETTGTVRTLGDLYYLWGKKDESLRYYGNYKKMFPKGECEKMIDLRIRLLNTLIDTKKLVNNHEKFKISMQAFRKKDYPRAEVLLREVIKFDPSHIHAYNNLGVIMKEQHKDWQEAKTLLTHAAMISSCNIYKKNLKSIELEMRKNEAGKCS